jgi:RNA binding exosome subunit
MLTRKAEGYAGNAIKDSEDRLARMKAERADIEEFLGTLRNLMTTESMVAADENSAVEQLDEQ